MSIYLLLFVGLIFRLINLNQSFWLDEVISVLTARDLSLVQLIKHFFPGDFHPPLHYFLLHFWGKFFGWSEISMRIPSILFGAGTIYIVYLISKEIFKRLPSDTLGQRIRLPLISALFLATAPFHIYYSQETRMYAMVTFFASLSIYFFIRVINYQSLAIRKKQFLISNYYLLITLYILSSTAMLYTDYYGFFILLAQIVILLLHRKYTLLLCCLVALLLFLPWLPMFLTQLKTGSQAMTTLPEWGKLVNLSFWKALPLTFAKFSLGRITIFNKKIYAAIIGILFAVYGAIVLKGFFQKKKFIIHNSLFIILAWFFIPLLSAWLISFFIPNYQPFRLLLVLPAFYLLLTNGISRLSTMMIRIIIVSLILAVNLISLGVYYLNPYFHREDWRGTVNYIEAQNKKAVVFLPSGASHWPYTYYSRQKIELIGVGQGTRPVEEIDLQVVEENMGKKLPEFVFYIRYLVPLFDPQEKINSWLREQGFVKIKEISFNQIPVWEYKRL